MAETIIESVLSGQLDHKVLVNWLNNDCSEDIPEDSILLCCNKLEFVGHFLSYLRNQTDSILQSNSNVLQVLQQQNTPDKSLQSQRKHHRSISDPTNESDRIDGLAVKTDKHRSHESPSRDRKKRSRIKTKLFMEDKSKESISSDESKLSIGVDRLALSSTPIKNGVKPEYPNLLSPVTPQPRCKDYERCDTPRLGRHSRSQDKSINFGDYLVNVQKSSKKKKMKNVSNDTDDSKVELDISNSEMFPEIGSSKSSKRRIKPTNIDCSISQKSFSLNSFNSDCFQMSSPLALEENVAFKQQKLQPKELANSFDIERNILKQEKQKLMEKFNLSTPKSPNKIPQVKNVQKEFIDKPQLNFIEADITKVTFKDKLDLLVELYNVLLKTNLILNFVTEIYFLVSILLTKQSEEDYVNVESQIEINYTKYLLKSIHNSTYLAVKVLWSQRSTLDVILDKNSLKILGENKKIRCFYPELAKSLLNSYGLRCEEESMISKTKQHESCSNGVIRFNFETDNAENFPSLLCFQNFKKQRDMFYEIFRGYSELQMAPSRTSFRGRIKTLLGSGPHATNYAHLAALFVAHMCDECLPNNVQESKLSKLQRRLTCPAPAASDSHRHPHFTANETFYKEFVMCTDNESFRVHLRDALASEIVGLDSTPFATEDRGNNSSSTDISKDFLQLSKKLRLISKLLGYLTSLPYSQPPIDSALKTTSGVHSSFVQKDQMFMAPKEKVLENNIALRNYSQPTIDLNGMLSSASETGRLSITVPWIVQYLSMLDYTSLRINYYNQLILCLLDIYYHRLKINTDTKFKKNTVIFLKATLGWLFDLPHFPQMLQVKKILLNSVEDTDFSIDYCDLIDESILFELCPYLKDIGVLLSTCKVSKDEKDVGSFRHITPVSLTLNPEERIRNKEKEIQARLEEELIRCQPSTTRRVVEVVIERVWRDAVRSLSGDMLSAARVRVRDHAAVLLRTRKGDQSTLINCVQAVYNDHLNQLRTKALETSAVCIKQRTCSALAALLPSAPQPLQAVAAKSCLNKVRKWVNDNWSTTQVLCKDIESEVRTLQALGDAADGPRTPTAVDVITHGPGFDAAHPSPAAAVILLKETNCLLLDYSDHCELSSLLDMCASCCSPRNMFCRAPTQRAILQLTIDLCLICVSRKPTEVTEEFLNKLHIIWNICCPERKSNTPRESEVSEQRDSSPDLRNFDGDDRAPTPVSDNETDNVKIGQVNAEMKTVTESKPNNSLNDTKMEERGELLGFFDRILCPRNIVLLSSSSCEASRVWEAMATVLVFLLNNNYLSENSLTEQYLSVYTQDWPKSLQKNLSSCMKLVSTKGSKYNGNFNFTLFMADFCTNMDYQPSD